MFLNEREQQRRFLAACSETVLEVEAEGGSLAVVRLRNTSGTWEYFCARDETAISSLLQDDEIKNDEGLSAEYASLGRFEDALLALDKWPWFRLYPGYVHREFADIVLREVENRGGKDAAIKWTERLSHRQTT